MDTYEKKYKEALERAKNIHKDAIDIGENIRAKQCEILNTLEVKEVQESTAADKGTAEEIIINLKRVEQDYHIDLTREMEWLRNQVKKGE